MSDNNIIRFPEPSTEQQVDRTVAAVLDEAGIEPSELVTNPTLQALATMITGIETRKANGTFGRGE